MLCSDFRRTGTKNSPQLTITSEIKESHQCSSFYLCYLVLASSFPYSSRSKEYFNKFKYFLRITPRKQEEKERKHVLEVINVPFFYLHYLVLPSSLPYSPRSKEYFSKFKDFLSITPRKQKQKEEEHVLKFTSVPVL